MHFSLRDDILVLQMQCDQIDDPVVLIPSSKLQGDLPPALVDGHVHLLNPSGKFIEIRPLDRLWEESSDHWRIDLASGSYHMYRGRETLVDIRSPTWAMFSKCFHCLDTRSSDRPRSSKRFNARSSNEPMNLMITTSPINSASVLRLSVTLPCYSLSFFVNEMQELQSRDFKQMVYDEDQCAGTLFGLENILILRPTRTLVSRTLIPRRILVPNGEPIMHGDHQVQKNTPAAPRDGSLYHTYIVDTELGCLVGNGRLPSTEFLAGLHAMTSWHRPDSLTGKTGAQAALCLLQSAGCHSIMKLKILSNGNSWTQYPQIQAAYKEISSRYYWTRDFWHQGVSAAENSAAQRAAYLFPAKAPGQVSSEDCIRFPSESRQPTPSCTVSSLQHIFHAGSPTQITLDYLMRNRPVPGLPARITLLRDSYTTSSEPDDISVLDQIFSNLQTDHSFQQKYLIRLNASVQYLRLDAESCTTHRVAGDNLIEVLEEHYAQSRSAYVKSLEILKERLGPTTSPYEQAHNQFGQWPPTTANLLLQYLASTSQIDIPPGWRTCLTSLALLLLDLQRARRLLRFTLEGLEEDFLKELANDGCDGWDPEKYPDWLLIQVRFFFSSTRIY